MRRIDFINGKLFATVACMLVVAGPAWGADAPGQGLKALERTHEVPVIKQNTTPPNSANPVPDQENLVPVKKILVNKFKVKGNTLLSEADIRSVLGPLEGKELSLDDLKGVADLLTAKYRDAGYLIAAAYVLEQSIIDNTVIITVVEGYVGDVSIQNNKHYSSSFILRHLSFLKDEKTLEEEKLERQLLILNDYPGLTIQASLMAGKTPGATDIIATVNDRFPISGSMTYDNYGVDTTSKHRASVALDVGNLIMSGDLVTLRGILGLHTIDLNKSSYGRFEYLAPIGGNGLQMGAYVTNSIYAAGAALAPLEINGSALIAGAYASYPIIRKRDETLSTRLVFEYGSMKNNMLTIRDNHDEIRKLVFNASYDLVDRYLGRNFIGFSYSRGLGALLGGTASGDIVTSDGSSYPGADNTFNKFTVDAMRIQKISGYYSNLTARVSGQYSPNRLFLSEQFSIGGVGTIRGFDPATLSGDSGLLGSLELASSPLFPNTVIPVINQRIEDTIKFALFTDYGAVFPTDPQASEVTWDHLWSVGVGARLYVGRYFTCKFDWAAPSHNGGLNGKLSKYYIQATLSF